MPAFFPASQQAAGSTRQLLREPDGSVVRRTVLPTGLRITSESVPGARSVTLGIWVGVGSRDETKASAGAAHFLEHLLFKGTATRSAMDVAAEVDAIGGQMNAFTSKEATCFYTKALGDDLSVAVDVMMDITTRPSLRPEDIAAEKSVVLEEIGMHDDDPMDRANEALEQGLLAGTPLSLPILGTRDSITTMSVRTIRGFFRRHYRAPHLAVTAAGNVDHGQLVSLVRDATAALDWGWGEAPAELALRRPRSAARDRGAVTQLKWPGEQCTVALATRGLSRTDPRRRTLDVLNTIIGGGMSSRLFQSVREERGLAYAIHSGHSAYADTGVWSVAAGCQPDRAGELFDVVTSELASVRDEGLSSEEVARAKGHLAGSIVLAGEETAARMVALGRAEVATGELITLDKALARVDAVTVEGVNAMAHEVLAQPRHVVSVGAGRAASIKKSMARASEAVA